MIEMIFQYIYEFEIGSAYKLFNSQFMSSVIGALAGAFAGAYAAHKIATSAKRREFLEAQIRSTNVAISSVFLTCNYALGLKGQHVLPLYTSYISEKKRFENSINNHQADGSIHFSMDLKTLHMPFVPFNDVSRIIQEQVNLRGRPLALVPTIQNSLTSLQASLEYMNKLIEQFKTNFQGLREEHKLKIYFGLPLPDGNVHQEYSDTLLMVYQYTDNVIFFSRYYVPIWSHMGTKFELSIERSLGGILKRLHRLILRPIKQKNLCQMRKTMKTG